MDIPLLEMPEISEDDEEDILGALYVERETSFMYEVKFFEDFVLARPASPTFYLAIRKMSHNDFANEFDEYYGDHEAARVTIASMLPDFIIS